MLYCGSGIYTLPSARIAITDKSGTDKTEYRNVGSVIVHTVDTNQWETKQFIGSSLDEWLNDTKWTGFGGSGSGSGSGFYNVTLLHPLASGFYSKDSAVVAVSSAEIPDEQKSLA